MAKLKFSNILFPLALLLVVFIIFLRNYVPGTFLSGWDNLHPEFNLKVNLLRGVFSVWEEYQGLGLLAGNAHSANILHTLFAYLLSILGTPMNLIRYFYHFLMLAFGILGLYFFLIELKLSRWVSFLGAFYYALNLGTVQVFYMPYISFSHFFGFLPWLLYGLLKYAGDNSRRNFLALLVLNFLAIPAFYIPTIFIVYVVCILSFGLIVFADSRRVFFKALFGIFVINSFWILPFSYFVFSNISFRYNTLSTSIGSEKLFLENRKYGTLLNTAILKGFWFGNVDLQIDQGKFDYVMRPWIDHLQNPWVAACGYGLSLIVFIGLLYFFISFIRKRRNPALFGVSSILVISLFFLLNENPPLGFIYALLRRSSALFSEIFRFPFTKWVVPAVLSYAIFFAFGINAISHFISKYLKGIGLKKVALAFSYLLVILAISIWCFPVFKGNLIYKNLRVQIPEEYFELFKFFATQPKSERIANFPQYTFWGWNYYDWGYRGSGFLWYGIEQPILDRAFDVWNPKNEEYYKDVTYALYSNDAKLFYEVLNKYQISWVMLDENVIQSEGVIDSLYNSNLEKILESNPKIVFSKKYGDIKLYKVVLDYYPQDYFYFSDKNLSSVIRGDVSEIDASVSFDRGEYTLNFPKPLSIAKKDALKKYFDAENLIPAEVSAMKEGGTLNLKFSYEIPLFDSQELAHAITIYAGREANFILSINSTQFIRLSSVGSTYKFYGRVLMNTKGNTAVNLYSSTPSHKKVFDLEDSISTVYSCAYDAENSSVSASVDGDAVKLSGNNSAPCLQLHDAVSSFYDYNLFSIYYDYRSQDSELPEYCLMTDALGKCLNNKFGNRPGRSTDWNSYTDLVEIPRDKYARDVILTFALSAYGDNKAIWYKNIELSYYPLIFAYDLEDKFGILSDRYSNFDTLNISKIPFDNRYFVREINALSGIHSQYARNCDSFDDVFVYKEVEGTSIKYYSKDAVNCEDFELLKLPQAIGYMFFIDSENVSGMPLTFCIANTSSKKCDVVRKLLGGVTSIAQPAMSSDLSDSGYTIHIESTSVGDQETINSLKAISIYYYPSLWIRSLFSSGARTSIIRGPNSSIVERSSKYNPSFYKLSVKLTEGDNLLAFSQTYDKGWVVYNASEKTFVTKHFVGDGWANGWGVVCTKGPVCTSTLYVFYWPQILEFVGFAALLALFFSSIKSKRTPETPSSR